MPQSNLTLIYEIYSDRALLSGGSWQPASLRLDNLRSPYLAEVARSTSLAPSATQFTVDLNAPFVIGGLALGACNAQPAATARVRAYSDAARTDMIHDSGSIQFPGTAFSSGVLEWEDAGFWMGVTREADDNNKHSTLIYIPTYPVSAQYWLIEIFDEMNPAGFIEIGRLIMGRRWSPTLNYTYDGNSLDFEDLSGIEESRGGVRFFDRRPIRRSFSFGFPYLPDAETFRDVFRIVVRSGVSGQVVIVPNPADPDSYQAEAFIGRLKQLPSLRRPAFGQAATAFTVEEVL